MTGYVRVDTSNNISDGNVIAAADLDNEFDGVQAGFNASTGHTHGGAAGEGAPITKLGPTQDVTASASLLAPKTTNTVDVGSSTLKFKDLWLAGNASVAGTTTLSSALTYGGVTLSNAVTGTGNMVLSTSPTLVTPALGTPASGVVTNLTGTASININGTVGATTASTGAFTTLTTSSTVTLNGGTSNGVTYLNGSKVLTSGSALTFDGSNLGLGVTPSAWASSIKVLELPNSGFLAFANANGNISTNTFFDTGYKYKVTDAAARYGQSSGQHAWYTAPSGTAGAAITFTQAMTLDASGRLLIGTTTAQGNFTVNPNTTENVAGFFGSSNPNQTDVIIAQTGYNSVRVQNKLGNLIFATGAAATERARIDAAGNLGLGVTPSAWIAPYKVFQIGTGIGIGGVIGRTDNSNQINFGLNYTYTGGASLTYVASSFATNYAQELGSHRWYTAPSGTAGAAITFTQAMTLDASGRLGIGETSPGQTLAVKSSSSPIIRVGDGIRHVELRGGSTTQNAAVGTYFGGDFSFFTNSIERARIDASGNFLVGKTALGTTVVGFSAAPVGTVTSTRASAVNTDSTYEVYSTGATAYRFYVGMAGTVFATSTTISAISDQRLKENVQDLDVGLGAVMALKPRKFDWKAGKGKDIKGDRGFIAQEFEQVFPDLIDEWKDAAPEGEDPYKSVRADLIPVLVKAIQEQQAVITALTARVAALEAA